MILFFTLANVHDLNQNQRNYCILAIFTLLLNENGLRSTTIITAWNPRNYKVIRCETKILIDYFFPQLLPDTKLITGPAAILVLQISVQSVMGQY